MFYGISLGLFRRCDVADLYTDVETRVGEEAAAVGTLYRDVSSFPDPNRTELQADLRQYVRQVIGVAWPQQRRGIVPEDEGATLSTLQTNLSRFEPATEGQKVIFAEAYRGFNTIAAMRGRRLQSVHAGLARPLWTIVLAGAFLSIAMTWFFDMRSQSMHFWMTVMLSALLGLLIYLLAALDSPFRGEISVGPEAFEIMYFETDGRREMILKRYSQTAALFSFESLLRLRAAPGLRERSPVARKGGVGALRVASALAKTCLGAP